MARPGRHQCHTCRSRAYTARHPDIVSFLNLKKSAKRRGHEFSLTIQEFREFAAKYDYLDKRGRQAWGYTVDRVDREQGYHAWNIQVLTNSENAAKDNRDRKMAYVTCRVHGWPMGFPDPF